MKAHYWLVRWNGVAWAQTPTPTSQSLYAVEAISASDAWAFGENVILRWNGSTWLEAAGFGVGALFYPTGATAVSADDVWAVGGYGRIIHWDGLAWNEVNSSTSAYIGAIAMSGPEDGWIVGFGGTILRWNGQVWAPSASPTRAGLRSVAVGGPDNAWAVGDAGTVLRYVGATPHVVAPIEQPPAGALVSGTVTLRGYAIDLGSAAGTGIDAVHIYLDGPYGTGTIIGGATYGLDRPDVAAQYGARFGPSGWELSWDTAGVAPGVHRLYLYAHRTTDNAWSLMDPHLVIVAGGHAIWLPVVVKVADFGGSWY